MRRLFPALLFGAFILSGCGGSSGGANDTADTHACTQVYTAGDVLVINLSPDTDGGACTVQQSRELIAECVAQRIRAHYSTPQAQNCFSAFDVFVPGTGQEDGNYKQFTRIISDTPGRTYLALQYSENPDLWDKIEYDKSTREARDALDTLLYALKSQFQNPHIRVFGHSKGSDAVAQASRLADYGDVQFFAFAQPGRTDTALRGDPGYIEKLGANLVGFTWANDEVKFYSGGANGLVMPEIWGWPGYVNQAGGGASVLPVRIDHHNNYGGDITETTFPYCATGHKGAMLLSSECKQRSGVRYHPYFWGDGNCTQKAFDMMANAAVGERYYIGYSGPRATGCKDTLPTVQADYSLTYRINLADQDDCRGVMQLNFFGLDFGTDRTDGGEIKVTSTEDTGWITKTGTVRIPLHMQIRLWDYLQHVHANPNILNQCKNSLAQSEIYTRSLVVTFTHPQTGQTVTRTLIGLDEGIDYIWPLKLADKNNVAWRKETGTWDLHYGFPPSTDTKGGLMGKGPTEGGRGGIFYKWVHLVD